MVEVWSEREKALIGLSKMHKSSANIAQNLVINEETVRKKIGPHWTPESADNRQILHTANKDC